MFPKLPLRGISYDVLHLLKCDQLTLQVGFLVNVFPSEEELGDMEKSPAQGQPADGRP